jgi:hypothetical protein
VHLLPPRIHAVAARGTQHHVSARVILDALTTYNLGYSLAEPGD